MRFVRLQEVMAMVGVSRTTLWRLVVQGVFPAPVWVSPGRRGFRLEEVEEWIEARTVEAPLALATRILESASGRAVARHGPALPPLRRACSEAHSSSADRWPDENAPAAPPSSVGYAKAGPRS